jgi:hypothetical protein
VILIYWLRLLEVNFSESMSRELLPIMRLARGLLPATIVACIGFCGLSHAFYALHDFDDDSDIFLNSFAMLITGTIPDPEAHRSNDKVMRLLIFISVLVFTVFFLNIFIGVIGELYSDQKALSGMVFQNVRAGICAAFLLRASVVPSDVLSRCAANCLTVCAAAVAIGVQIYRFTRPPGATMLGVSVFVACQFLMVFASYQNPAAPWGRPGRGSAVREPHYLWFVEASEQMRASQLDEMQATISKLEALLDDGTMQVSPSLVGQAISKSMGRSPGRSAPKRATL